MKGKGCTPEYGQGKMLYIGIGDTEVDQHATQFLGRMALPPVV